MAKKKAAGKKPKKAAAKPKKTAAKKTAKPSKTTVTGKGKAQKMEAKPDWKELDW